MVVKKKKKATTSLADIMKKKYKPGVTIEKMEDAVLEEMEITVDETGKPLVTIPTKKKLVEQFYGTLDSATKESKVSTGTITGTTKKKKIALIDATEVGQAVSGSAPTSVYTVVALSEDLKIAARVSKGAQGYKLSVRAEGEALKKGKVKNRLTLVKLAKSTGGTHWSAHFNGIKTPQLVMQTLGAVIYGTGHNFESLHMITELLEE